MPNYFLDPGLRVNVDLMLLCIYHDDVAMCLYGGGGGPWSDQGGPWIPQPFHTDWASSAGFLRCDNALDGIFSTKALLLRKNKSKAHCCGINNVLANCSDLTAYREMGLSFEHLY